MFIDIDRMRTDIQFRSTMAYLVIFIRGKKDGNRTKQKWVIYLNVIVWSIRDQAEVHRVIVGPGFEILLLTI